MSDTSGGKQRREKRIPMRFYGRLNSGNISTEVHVVNLSEGGALVAILDDDARPGLHDEVDLALEIDYKKELQLQGKVVHTNAHMLGICFEAPLPDVIAQLKTFIKSSGF